MNDTNEYSFNKLYDDLHLKREKHLILGNGFSIAASKKFDYKSLYQAADLTEQAKEIFERCGTNNFEDVIRTLENTIATNKTFKIDSTRIEEEKELIKSLLVQTISKVHPDRSEIAKNNDLECCASFISKFNSILTFNYDLLPYWVAMKAVGKHVDGFINKVGVCVFKNYFPKNITRFMYMHGAIHLFKYKRDTYKRIKRESKTVTELVKEAMREEKYPLVVTEGDSLSKRKKIDENQYLKTCWEYFGNIGGAVFTYGLSFCDQDNHISQTIIENKKIRDLYIGYYKDKTSIENNVRKIRNERSDLHVAYYKSEEAGVWGVKEGVRTKHDI